MNNTEQQTAIQNILAERQRQSTKWGDDDVLDAFEWLAILGEEFGELSHALLHDDGIAIKTELTQAAAVSLAWLESIERRERGQ